MLVRSHRHTAKDLELWAELEAADLVHFSSDCFQNKYAQAAKLVAEFSIAAPCYCSVSWGKDSTVIAHLSSANNAKHNAHFQIPLAWVTVGEQLDAGCAAVRDWFLSQYPVTYREVLTDAGERTDKGTKGKRVGFRAIEAALGKRRIMGIRGDESGGRMISARHRGAMTINVCRPLIWWTADDVFACLAGQGLPVHPNYAMLGGGRWDRSQLRTAPLAGKRGDNFGRREWEQEYYGDVLRRLCFEKE